MYRSPFIEQLRIRKGSRFTRFRFFGAFQYRLIGKRSERGDKKRTLCRFDDTGITIVDGTIVKHLWPSPRLSTVIRTHPLQATKGTNMLFSSA